jgi:hypothetical protein
MTTPSEHLNAQQLKTALDTAAKAVQDYLQRTDLRKWALETAAEVIAEGGSPETVPDDVIRLAVRIYDFVLQPIELPATKPADAGR